MDFFPVFLNIKGKPCLLVGGGDIAARKASQLLRAGAEVRVVAPVMGEKLTALAAQYKMTQHSGRFEPADLEGCVLVIAATDDNAVNRAVHAAAVQKNIMSCAVAGKPSKKLELNQQR